MVEYTPTEQVFKIDPALRIREELVSIHAINPFVPSNSASRGAMSSAHISQSLALLYGENKIVQAGLEIQFAKNTFSKKAENDVRVLKIISRYDGLSVNSVNALTEILVIVEDLETRELDYIGLPYYFTLHQYFGFKYVWNHRLLEELVPGMVIPKGTVFADSPNVGPNGEYRYGINANIALWSIPETAEDGVVISESMADKLAYKVFESRTIEFGTNDHLLNLYGEPDRFQPFPEIGQRIREDSVLVSKRAYDPELSPALVSRMDVMEHNPTFDENVYVKGPGKTMTINGHKYDSGRNYAALKIL